MPKTLANSVEVMLLSLQLAKSDFTKACVTLACVTCLLALVLAWRWYSWQLLGTFPFNAFLSGVFSCIGTSALGICLRMLVNPANKEFKDLPPERAFADFVLINLVLHLVIMNFLG